MRAAPGYLYLSRAHLDGFSKYVYRSIDDSPLSIYMMKPFWNWLVQVSMLLPVIVVVLGQSCPCRHHLAVAHRNSAKRMSSPDGLRQT